MNLARRLSFLSLFLLSGNLIAAELVAPDFSIEKAIDHYIQARLTERQVQPVPAADDCTLVRRTSLDLQGRIPTVTETKQLDRKSVV